MYINRPGYGEFFNFFPRELALGGAFLVIVQLENQGPTTYFERPNSRRSYNSTRKEL